MSVALTTGLLRNSVVLAIKCQAKPFLYYKFNKTAASLLGSLTSFTLERNLYQSIKPKKLQKKDTSFASLKVMLHSSQDKANAHAADYN